jgi:outer membrane protein TolC
LTSTNDVTRAQIDLSTSEVTVAQAQGTVERAYTSLSFLLGQRASPPLIPPDNTTRAAERYEQAQKNQVKSALERKNDAIRAAEGRRPDVRSAHEKTEANRDFAREPLYRLAPTVTATGRVTMLSAPPPTSNAVDENASMNLTWTIFDAGFRYADRRTRLAQAESSELDEKLLRRSVGTDVDLALASLRAARASYGIAEVAVAAAVRNTAETTTLYRQGLARAIEVTDANQKQFDAEVTLESAKLSMEQAYLDLRSALGFGPLDEDAPER